MDLRLPLAFALVFASGCASEATSEDEEPDATEASAQTELPPELAHSDADSPVPTWDQLTRRDLISRARFEALSPAYRRGFVLLIDKIANEGWLGSIETIKGEVFDTAFHFWPRGSFEQVMEAKTSYDRRYTENNLQSGVFAYLNAWNHKEWVRGWMENDVPNAALHIGKHADGSIEVHMETYNPMFTNGAKLPRYVVVWAPGFGSLNHTTWRLHRKWENDPAMAPRSRTSANYYHFMKTVGIPLSF